MKLWLNKETFLKVGFVAICFGSIRRKVRQDEGGWAGEMAQWESVFCTSVKA